ncbi:hypothetical protein BDZ97DRAFT_2077538 [Flammula alnicola]|nr:hypothetical protein BDZ97DRAFT_2077538 [Flammula alnicola]
MRAFSVLTLASALFGAVSALTVPVKRSDIDSVEFLEARANPIKFSNGAKQHMTNLGLAKGSAERKEVKAYHRKIVGEEMAKNGAHSAQVVHLAHKVGSVDPKLHVTAGFWDKDDKRIKSSYGDPPKSGNLHHVYAEHHPVNPTYLNAVHAAGKTLRRRSDDSIDYLEARANPIKFSNGAKQHLTNLGLAKGSAERKEVKEYHRNIVAGKMAEHGAHSAQVVHLAHKEGSVDPRLHVTAGLWDKDNKRIKSTFGEPPKSGNLHHAYGDPHAVNPTYLAAVHKAGKTL